MNLLTPSFPRFSPFLVATMLTAGFLCLNPVTAVEVIDDDAMREYFQKGTEHLLKKGVFPDPKAFQKELAAATNSAPEITLANMATKSLSQDRLVDKCDNSVVMVGSLYNCGHCPNWHISCAGAVAIGKNGIFVTNYHVLEDEKGLNEAIAIMTKDRRIFPVTRVLAASKANDLAIFEAKGAKLRPLPLGTDPEIGETVHAIHHPRGRFFTYTQGVVSRHFIFNDNGTKVHRMAITADYAQGSSGSPILDDKGNLVGLVASTNTLDYKSTNEKRGYITQMVVKSCVPASSIMHAITVGE